MGSSACARLAAAAVLAAGLSSARPEEPAFLSPEKRAEDLGTFCRFVRDEYAYFDRKRTDWDRACGFYLSQAVNANSREAFVELLERALGELYDHHAHLGTNTPRSYRLVPTHADLFATWREGRAMVAAVRPGSAAEAAGVLAGMEVVAIDGEPAEAVVRPLEPRFLPGPDPAARDWALQVALAGRRDRPGMRLTTRIGGELRELLVLASPPGPASMLSHRIVGQVGYLRIHNSLGDPALVQAFDDALAGMAGVRALVIDLRDTPSGGTSSVARGIMGRLVPATLPYQRHELVSELRSTGIRRIWEEYVAPRGSPFLKPIVVLVGRWTGSMGEGLAIGLDATRGAPVLGQPMAHLLGANGETILPHSGIVVRVPTERLSHVDGTPREAFVPSLVPSRPTPGTQDGELEAALALASRSSTRKSSGPAGPRARPRAGAAPRP